MSYFVLRVYFFFLYKYRGHIRAIPEVGVHVRFAALQVCKLCEDASAFEVANLLRRGWKKHEAFMAELVVSQVISSGAKNIDNNW